MDEKKTPRLKIAAIIVLALTLLYMVLTMIPRMQSYEEKNPLRRGDLPLLIAHGGGNGEFPDNTLEAFYNAYSVDKNVMMETDVSMTKDGVVILSHDTSIDRKTNKKGAIADWNYSDLISEGVDFGYDNSGAADGELIKYKNGDGATVTPLDVEYPDGVSPRHSEIFLATTLEELLVAFPDNFISVEIKQSGEQGMRCLAEAVRLVDEYDAYGRVVFASFHLEIYSELLRMHKEGELPKECMYSPNTDGVVKFFLLHLVGLDAFFFERVSLLQIPTDRYGLRLDTAELVNRAHQHNIAVHYWTINDIDVMRHLINIGADGITTDYPHRLKEVLDEAGKL